MNDIEYLYCINDFIGEDFITTSFEYFWKEEVEFIRIYNFNQEIDISVVTRIAIDYSLDVFLSFNSHKYSNSKRLKTYRVKFIEQDIDRKTAELEVIEEDQMIDLVSYKRDLKINHIIN